jgi:hypothetical protein
MSTVLPIDLTLFNQPNVGFINESRCLERMLPAFAPHIAMCQAAQFAIYEGHQPVERPLISQFPTRQQSSDLLR